jgi:hypothetical protein
LKIISLEASAAKLFFFLRGSCGSRLLNARGNLGRSRAARPAARCPRSRNATGRRAHLAVRQVQREQLKIFSQALPGPVFFEFILRKKDEGSGERNFKARFESIE